MVSRELTAPGKTFLLGEYLALVGGPAILLSNAPRFKLLVTSSEQSSVVGIHPDSPAGKFIAKYPETFEHYKLEFVDPYHGMGGLGASSAQFALCFAWQQKTRALALNNHDIFSALDEYQQVAWDGEGVAPSGADVVVQLKGEVCYFHKKEKKIETFVWPFAEFDFCLLHTGKKIATHHHLKALGNLEYTDLENLVNTGLASLKNKDAQGLATAINHYAERLLAKNLVVENTQVQLKKIHQQSGVMAAKGCGALGADIIFVMLEKSHTQTFTQWASQQELKVICAGNQASEGVLCDKT